MAAGLAEAGDQPGGQPLPGGVGRRGFGEFCDEFAAPARPAEAVGEPVEGAQPQVVQVRGGPFPEQGGAAVGERGAVPEVDGGAQERECRVLVRARAGAGGARSGGVGAAGQVQAGPVAEPLEAQRVDAVGVAGEDVAGAAGAEGE